VSALCNILMVGVLSLAVSAQSAEPPLSDTRLRVNTLVREDIFAGFLAGDMESLERGELNARRLLQERPDSRGDLQSWLGLSTMYRAVLAREAGDTAGYKRLFKQASDLFAEVRAKDWDSPGVIALFAPCVLLFADRTAPEDRPALYALAYDAYRKTWDNQGPNFTRLPPHMQGELLGGLAQSAQRTGHTDEMNQHLDKILTALAGSPYEPMAKQWRQDPKVAAGSTLICKSCHDAGRLEPTLARLGPKT
jgi:hypothetical protein